MQPSSLPHAIETESWDHIARMLVSFPVEIEGDGRELRRIRKELGILKHALYGEFMTFNGNQTIDASFFVGAFKAVSRIDRDLEAQGIKNQKFVMFLKLLFHRLRKQKLVVKKPMKIQNEFGRMKRVVENANTI
jgi:hypothetical protein